MDLREGEHCLICCSEIPPTVPPDLPFTTACSLLDKHLEVIFLLRKVLEVPVGQLAKFLEGCSSLEGWISVCDSCAEAVKQCKLIYQELLEANRKWRECKQEIVNVIKVTKDEKGGDAQEAGGLHGMMDISQSTRLFVKTHEYEDWRDPFIAGDLKAADELQNLDNNPVGKKEMDYPKNPSASCDSPEPDNFPVSSDDDEYNPEVASDEDKDFEPTVKRKRAGIAKPNKMKDACIATAGAKKLRGKYRKQNKPKMTEESLKRLQIKKAHQRKNRPSMQPVDCHVCGHTLSTACTLKNHLYTQHAIGKRTKPHKQSVGCHVCGRTISSSRSLRKHLYSKHGVGDPQYQCPRCHRMFPEKYDLKIHLKVCAKSVDPTPTHLHTDEHFMPPGNHFRIKCPVPGCPLHWPIVSAYRNHLQTQHTPEERAGLDKLPKILECLTCGKLVGNKREAKVHRFLHDQSLKKENEVVCEVCGATVQGKEGLGPHKKNSLQCRLLQGQTEAEATVVCDICGKRVTGERSLQRHQQVVHQKKFNLFCEHCGKGYRGNIHLKVHLASAHGIVEDRKVELKCPVEGCGKIFYHRQNWKDHQKGVHKQGEPEQKCQECGKAFYTYRSLSQHVSVVHRARRRKPKKTTEEERRRWGKAR